MRIIILHTTLYFIISTAHADSFTGVVNRLAPNASPSYNGILVKFENTSSGVITLNSSSNCSSPWGFFEVETGIGKAIYSTLLTAYTLNQPVTIYTKGCATSQNFPKIEEIYLE